MEIVLVTVRRSNGPPGPAPDQCTVECTNPQELADLGQLLGRYNKDRTFVIVGLSVENPQQQELPSHYAMAGFRTLFL